MVGGKMSKFQVGDKTISNTYTPETAHSYRIIQRIEDGKYYYKLYSNRDNSTKDFIHNYGIEGFDNIEQHYYKKIKATKIARKLYKNKIVQDLGDYIEVRV